MYFDDIILTGTSLFLLQQLQNLLNACFRLKELGTLKFFLGLEIARTSKGICLSQRHYTLTPLEDAGLLRCRPTSVHMDPLVRLRANDSKPLLDPSAYRRLVGRLLYLTISRSDITFVVHRLSQFISQSCKLHLTTATYLLRYLKTSLGQGVFLFVSSSYQLRAFADAD